MAQWLRGFDAQGQESGRIAFDARRGGNRRTGLPAVQGQVAGDAANGITCASAQVDASVGIEINRETPLAAGHELRDAHGAGVRTANLKTVHVVFAGEQEKMLKFTTEKGRSRRVFEGQRGQRFKDAELPGVAPVLGFHANDCRDDFTGDAVDCLGTDEFGTVFLNELIAAFDPAGIHKPFAVSTPGALLLGNCCRLNCPQHGCIGANGRKIPL